MALRTKRMTIFHEPLPYKVSVRTGLGVLGSQGLGDLGVLRSQGLGVLGFRALGHQPRRGDPVLPLLCFLNCLANSRGQWFSPFGCELSHRPPQWATPIAPMAI